MEKCEDCGKEKPDVNVTNCPFTEEIHQELLEVKICDDCYQFRCDAIQSLSVVVLVKNALVGYGLERT